MPRLHEVKRARADKRMELNEAKAELRTKKAELRTKADGLAEGEDVPAEDMDALGVVQARQREAALDGNAEPRRQDLDDRRVVRPAADDANQRRALAAEGDRVIAKAKRQLAAERFEHAAGRVVYRRSDRVGRALHAAPTRGPAHRVLRAAGLVGRHRSARGQLVLLAPARR